MNATSRASRSKNLGVTDGAAALILRLASWLRPDSDDVQTMAIELLHNWRQLDAETLHPPGNHHADALSPLSH